MNPETEVFQEVAREGKSKIMEGGIIVPFPDSYVYSNASALSTSMMDVRIGFAEVLPDGKAHARVGIVMPVEHAVQLIMNLLEQVNQFERNFGEIRNPKWRLANGTARANAEALLKEQLTAAPSETDAGGKL